MAGKNQWVNVGKRQLELSNLDKILFPQDQISKAEVINYYLTIAPTILYHIKGRPLTLIRYPDGIDKNRFYQKNIPEWAPDWIESVKLGEEKIDYVIAEEPASLAWLANLASLELHQIHSRKPHYDKPDYMVFDLDPPEDGDFREVVDTAFRLREHIEKYSYHVFVKTTGGKGVHLVSPIEPREKMSAVFEASKGIARSYVDSHPDETTLQIKKKARKGRILIDIYRNRTRQTIVSPYSLRGRPGAPVSMPLTWNELDETRRSDAFSLAGVRDKLKKDGDAWEGIGGYAVTLHTLRRDNKTAGPQRRGSRVSGAKPEEGDASGGRADHENPDSPAEGNDGSEAAAEEHIHREVDRPGAVDSGTELRYKTPAQLEEYNRKRDFTKTSEPITGEGTADGNRFVIHRHHATRLHYDLRLEKDGVLKSWAVPKGLPPRPGVKRLAVQTEDHPLEYLGFEGHIPRQEYGGGHMWIFADGRYSVTKEKKNGLYFRLESTGTGGEYRMHKIKEDQWLLEKVERPQIDWLNDPVEPMHGESREFPPEDGYGYEVKWDGIRALIALEDGRLHIRSRNQNDITDRFPELQRASKDLRAACGLFDGEIVSLDETGVPSFQAVINRLRSSGKSAIEKASQRRPVHCYLFDCLYLDGRSIVGDPLYRRYEWLADVIGKGSPFRLSEMMDDGYSLFEAAKKHNLEGIMAKKRESRYLPGRRSAQWIKVKVRQTADCRVIGYTEGRGDREDYFGALLLAEGNEDGSLRYRGKVGTGFDGQSTKDLHDVLKNLETSGRPSLEHLPDEKQVVWVKPDLTVEISYGRFSDNGLYKEAVYIKMRTDLLE